MFLLLFTSRKSFQSISFSLRESESKPRSEWSETTLGVWLCKWTVTQEKKTKGGAIRTAPWPGLVPAGSARDAEEGRRGRPPSENSVCTSRTAGSSFSYTTGWDWNEHKSARGIIKWTVETAGFALTDCGQQRAEAHSLFVQPGSFGESLALELFPHVIQLDGLEKMRMEQRRSSCNIMDQTSFTYMKTFDRLINNS